MVNLRDLHSHVRSTTTTLLNRCTHPVYRYLSQREQRGHAPKFMDRFKSPKPTAGVVLQKVWPTARLLAWHVRNQGIQEN